MNTHLILSFLRDIQAHNERGWFQDHRDMYLAARDDFERGVEKAILRITGFDPSIAHVTVKDTTYRFYRDTRFSPDKSPYKTHLGAYICARGKKSFHGGYYIKYPAEFVGIRFNNIAQRTVGKAAPSIMRSENASRSSGSGV